MYIHITFVVCAYTSMCACLHPMCACRYCVHAWVCACVKHGWPTFVAIGHNFWRKIGKWSLMQNQFIIYISIVNMLLSESVRWSEELYAPWFDWNNTLHSERQEHWHNAFVGVKVDIVFRLRVMIALGKKSLYFYISDCQGWPNTYRLLFKWARWPSWPPMLNTHGAGIWYVSLCACVRAVLGTEVCVCVCLCMSVCKGACQECVQCVWQKVYTCCSRCAYLYVSILYCIWFVLS